MKAGDRVRVTVDCVTSEGGQLKGREGIVDEILSTTPDGKLYIFMMLEYPEMPVGQQRLPGGFWIDEVEELV